MGCCSSSQIPQKEIILHDTYLNLHHLYRTVEDEEETERHWVIVDGGRYHGQMEGNVMQGWGILQMEDGRRYEGFFMNGLFHGQGKLCDENSQYIGSFQNGECHGQGQLKTATSLYEGRWEHNMQNGQGSERFADGATYKGSYLNGKRHGKGYIDFADSSYYRGDFFEGEIHGQGIFRWVDGSEFKGQWMHNQFTQGIMKWPDGRIYEGQYRDDLKQGIGKFVWPDGRIYIGEWNQGKQHGYGYFTKNNETRKGEWNMGKRDVLVKVFQFYSKQQYIQGQYATFERQQYESTIFTLGKWMHFCRDFQISATNQKLIEIFKKNAVNSKELHFEQFQTILNIMAKEQGLELDQFLSNLGFDDWKNSKKKMKQFQKPFQMRDVSERISEVNYQYKVFHPEVKDDEQIKQILQQRKEQNEQIKQQEKEKKDLSKLYFQLKHFTKQELLEKYPNLAYLIERLPNPSKPTTCSYIKKQKSQQQSKSESQQRQSALTWESLDHLPITSDFLKDIIDEEEDDQYLKEYQISSKPNSVSRYNTKDTGIRKLNKNRRSNSDYHRVHQILNKSHDLQNKSLHILNPDAGQIYKVNFVLQSQAQKEFINKKPISQQYIDSNLIRLKIQQRQQQQQLNQQNYSVELPRKQGNQNEENNDFSFQRDKQSPNKLNISMLRRVQQIQGLEAIKEKNLLNQIISQQREKQKVAQK